jgi:hypothetical protein
MSEHDAASTRLQTICLCFVLALGALLRFYALEVPSMWWDEIYTPMTSRYSWPFIRDWCRAIEIQPPYFYMAMKGYMLSGVSDFALRLPFALCGVLTSLAVYCLGKRILSPVVGLAAAAFIAFNPQMLWLSRTVRIYTLLHLLFALSMISFYRAYFEGNRRSEIQMYCLNFLMLLLHHSSVLIIGAEGFVLLVFWGMRKNGLSLWRVAVFALVSLASFVPSAPYFLGSVVDGGWLQVKSDYATVADKVFFIFSSLLIYMDKPVTKALFLGLFCLSLATWKGKRDVFIWLSAAFVLPLAAIVAKRYDSHMFFFHLTFLLVPFSLIVAAPLRFCKKQWPVLLAIVAFSLIATFQVLRDGQLEYYAVESNDRHVYPQGVFKTMARELPGRFAGYSLVPMEHDLPIFNAVNWYLEQFSADNPLTRQRLDRDRTHTPVLFLEGYNAFAELAADREMFFSKYPGLEALPALGTYKPYRWSVPYAPLEIASPQPSLLTFTAAPQDFYAHVAQLRNVMLFPFDQGRIIPTINGAWTTYEVDIVNKASDVAISSFCLLDIANAGVGNRVEVAYRHDDGPWQEAGRADSPAVKTLVADMKAVSPWKVLTVRVSLWCDTITPLKGGSNLSTLGVVRMRWYSSGPEYASQSQSQMVQDILPQRLSTVATPGQSVTFGDDVVVQAVEGYPDWSVLTPQPGKSASVRVLVRNAPATAVYHPRADGTNGSVVVSRVLPPAAELNVFQGLAGKWSPIGLAVPFSLEPLAGQDEALEIRLYGSAQLWMSKGAVLFQ